MTRLRDKLLRRRPASVDNASSSRRPRPALADIAGAPVVTDLPEIVDGVGGETVKPVEEGGRRSSVEHADADCRAEVGRRTHHMRRIVARVAVVRLRVVRQIRDAVVPQRQPRPTLGHDHNQLATPTTSAVIQQQDGDSGVYVDPAPGRSASPESADEQVGETRANIDLRLVTAVEHLDAQSICPTDAALRVVENVDL